MTYDYRQRWRELGIEDEAKRQYAEALKAGMEPAKMLENIQAHIKSDANHAAWLANSARTWDVDDDIRKQAERLIRARHIGDAVYDLIEADAIKARNLRA